MASDGFYSGSLDADESVGATLHLQAGSVIETQCYQESGRRQDMALYVLRAQPQQHTRSPGTSVLADCVAISDEHYAWWHSDVFGSPGAPTAVAVLLHFCTSDVKRCRFGPPRRGRDANAVTHAVHVNRWRPVSDMALGTIPWLTAAHREAITRVSAHHMAPPPLPPPAFPPPLDLGRAGELAASEGRTIADPREFEHSGAVQPVGDAYNIGGCACIERSCASRGGRHSRASRDPGSLARANCPGL